MNKMNKHEQQEFVYYKTSFLLSLFASLNLLDEEICDIQKDKQLIALNQQ